ncbi:MAG: hypothetical protein R3F59_34050 [Myxococcota bacterium]
MWIFAVAAAAPAPTDPAWFTPKRCTGQPCKEVLGAEVSWAIGSRQPGAGGEVVRLDAGVDGKLVSVWALVAGDRVVDVRPQRPGDWVEAPAVAGWVTAALAAPASACATAEGECASFAKQAAAEGVTLAPVSSYERGERRVAVVDWLEGGEVRDRVWLYAEGPADSAKVAAVDESPRHAWAFLAGEVPASGRPERSPALEAWGATFVAAPDPAKTQVPRGSEVVGSGAFGQHGALCLDTPAGGMVVTVRAAGEGWEVVRTGYRSGCQLGVDDVL